MGRSANRLGFTGHEEDADSGLVYAKARYYDPAPGVFLSPDPAAGDPTQPLSLHPYLYAHANPTTYVDSTGAAAEALAGPSDAAPDAGEAATGDVPQDLVWSADEPAGPPAPATVEPATIPGSVAPSTPEVTQIVESPREVPPVWQEAAPTAQAEAARPLGDMVAMTRCLGRQRKCASGTELNPHGGGGGYGM